MLFVGCAGSGNFAYKPSSKHIADNNGSELARVDETVFKKLYFSLWHEIDNTEQEKTFNYFLNMPKERIWYKENLLQYTYNEILALIANMTESKAMSVNAITLRNTDIRSVPSKRPMFETPSRAGEGYPFDYAQNSRAYIATPLKVYRVSKNGDYYFAKSGVGYGWVDSRDVGLLSQAVQTTIESASLVSATVDGEAAFDKKSGLFVESINIGTLLPQINANTYYPKREENGFVVLEPVLMKNTYKLPLPISTKKISAIALELSNKPYGWGGILDDRDCSMFLRDIFINFGVVLPRNSADQANGYTDISKLSSHEKKEFIKANAKPWQSVFYMKGHIMLYVGIDKQSGEILAMHDAWGIKSFDVFGNEGRAMLGGVVTTTLEEGSSESWYDNEKSPYIKKIIGIKELF